jgi:hypothetical protein
MDSTTTARDKVNNYKTTLETGGELCKTHSKRVENCPKYTQNEWRRVIQVNFQKTIDAEFDKLGAGATAANVEISLVSSVVFTSSTLVSSVVFTSSTIVSSVVLHLFHQF